jgi:hypothetical protein
MERYLKDPREDSRLQGYALVRSALYRRATLLLLIAFNFWAYPADAIDPRLLPPIPQLHPDAPPGFEVVIPFQYKEMWRDYLKLRDNPGTSIFAINDFKNKYATVLQSPQMRAPYWTQYKVSLPEALQNVYAAQYTVRQDIVAGKNIQSDCSYPLRVHNGQLFLADNHHQFARYATAQPDGSIVVTIARFEDELRPRVPLKDLAIVDEFEGWFTPPSPERVIRTVGGQADSRCFTKPKCKVPTVHSAVPLPAMLFAAGVAPQERNQVADAANNFLEQGASNPRIKARLWPFYETLEGLQWIDENMPNTSNILNAPGAIINKLWIEPVDQYFHPCDTTMQIY